MWVQSRETLQDLQNRSTSVSLEPTSLFCLFSFLVCASYWPDLSCSSGTAACSSPASLLCTPELLASCVLVLTLPGVILEAEQVAEAHKCKHLPEQRQPWPGLSSSAQLSLTDVKYACALHNVTDISIFSTAKLQSHAWEEGAAAHYAGGSSPSSWCCIVPRGSAAPPGLQDCVVSGGAALCPTCQELSNSKVTSI